VCPMNEPEDLIPDSCHERFDIEAEIARGGFGAVYRARHRALDRQVAIKILLQSVTQDPISVQRFRQEARVVATLKHPQIVDIVDHEVDAAHTWIAYEFVEGSSLSDRLGRGPLPWRDACEMVVQILEGLSAAHKAGVVLRDLKPANLIVSQDGRCLILDFGIAKWAGHGTVQTQVGLVIGTPAYLSPEQITGDEITGHSDLYAWASSSRR